MARFTGRRQPRRAIYLHGKPPLEAPQTVAGLRLWLAADKIGGLSGGAAVATWADASGRANDATQPTGANQPTYQTAVINGLPVVRFDGSNDWMNLATTDLLAATNAIGAISFFAVAKLSATAATTNDYLAISTGTAANSARLKAGQRAPAGSGVWGMTARRLDADAAANIEDANDDTAWHVHSAIMDYVNGDGFLNLDGTQIGSNLALTSSGTTSATNALAAAVGGRADGLGEFWAGDIAELIVYVGANKIADADRDLVTNYLLTKYAITGGGQASSGAATGEQRTTGTSAGVKGAAGATVGAARVAGLATGVKGAAGATVGAQRVSGLSTGSKGAVGATQGQARTAGLVAVRKQALGATVGEQRTTGLAVRGAPFATGATSGQQRVTGQSTGTKGAVGAQSGQQRTAGQVAVRKQALGAGSGQQRSVGTASARKQATGATIGEQRTTGLATTAPPPPSGAAVGQQRVTGLSTGRKGAVGTASGQQRTAGASTGIHRAVGATSGQQRIGATTAGAKGGRGATSGQQRLAGQVVATMLAAVVKAFGRVNVGGPAGSVLVASQHQGTVTVTSAEGEVSVE
jgi:hypothetical protein